MLAPSIALSLALQCKDNIDKELNKNKPLDCVVIEARNETKKETEKFLYDKLDLDLINKKK